MVWMTVWFTVILKIPALYLCWVIWWAVKDPPDVEDETAVEELGGDAPGWTRTPARGRKPSRRGGPHGSPRRSARAKERRAPARERA